MASAPEFFDSSVQRCPSSAAVAAAPMDSAMQTLLDEMRHMRKHQVESFHQSFRQELRLMEQRLTAVIEGRYRDVDTYGGDVSEDDDVFHLDTEANYDTYADNADIFHLDDEPVYDQYDDDNDSSAWFEDQDATPLGEHEVFSLVDASEVLVGAMGVDSMPVFDSKPVYDVYADEAADHGVVRGSLHALFPAAYDDEIPVKPCEQAAVSVPLNIGGLKDAVESTDQPLQLLLDVPSYNISGTLTGCSTKCLCRAADSMVSVVLFELGRDSESRSSISMVTVGTVSKPSGVDDVRADKVGSYYLGMYFTCVLWVYLERQPWPPPVLFVVSLDNVLIRPQPWPSFTLGNVCSLSWKDSSPFGELLLVASKNFLLLIRGCPFNGKCLHAGTESPVNFWCAESLICATLTSGADCIYIQSSARHVTVIFCCVTVLLGQQIVLSNELIELTPWLSCSPRFLLKQTVAEHGKNEDTSLVAYSFDLVVSSVGLHLIRITHGYFAAIMQEDDSPTNMLAIHTLEMSTPSLQYTEQDPSIWLSFTACKICGRKLVRPWDPGIYFLHGGCSRASCLSANVTGSSSLHNMISEFLEWASMISEADHMDIHSNRVRTVHQLANDENGSTSSLVALSLVAQGGNVMIRDGLLERTAQIDARTKGACGWTPLHIAAKEWNKIVVWVLVESGDFLTPEIMITVVNQMQ